jgi:hypothetical protein
VMCPCAGCIPLVCVFVNVVRAFSCTPRLARQVWNTPLCQLFPSGQAVPPIAGRCDVAPESTPQQCSDAKSWCAALPAPAPPDATSKHTQALILMQLLRVSVWASAGLLPTRLLLSRV